MACLNTTLVYECCKLEIMLYIESSRLVKKGNNLGYYHGDDSREIITGEKEYRRNNHW